jgi:hypothetical protein
LHQPIGQPSENTKKIPLSELAVIIDPAIQFGTEPVGYLFNGAGTIAVYFHSGELFRDFLLRTCAYCQIKLVVDFASSPFFGRSGLKTKS